jgi:methylmalonyl-CoA/ethylmalonyl-CoA epimerase
MSVGFGPIMQHGYIVDDVEKAAVEWAERVDVGPFYVLDRILMDQYFFRGVRTDVELRLGFGYWQGIQIELIQQLNDADTLYSRALQASAGKLNHLATVVSDLDGLLASRGLQDRVVQRGNMPSGLKFVYLEEYLPGGLHLEVVEATESTLMAFAGMEKACRNWDGRNPVRPMSALGEDLARIPLNQG